MEDGVRYCWKNKFSVDAQICSVIGKGYCHRDCFTLWSSYSWHCIQVIVDDPVMA